MLCPKLISLSSSIPALTFLSDSFALCHGFLGSNSNTFCNVLPTYLLFWTLPLFQQIFAYFSHPKFLFMSVLITFTIFISFSKSSSHLPDSGRSYTVSNVFFFQFSVLDIHNQLCSARVLME